MNLLSGNRNPDFREVIFIGSPLRGEPFGENPGIDVLRGIRQGTDAGKDSPCERGNGRCLAAFRDILLGVFVNEGPLCAPGQ